MALMTDAFGGYGGIAQYNRDFLTALNALDPNGQIHVLPRIAPEVVEHLPGRVIQHSPLRSRIAYSIAAIRLALKLRPDIVVCGHLYHGPLARRIAAMNGAKLTSQLHGTEVWKPLAKKHLHPLEKSDLVFCVSEDTRRRYLAQREGSHDNTVVIHNTVDSRFQPRNRDAARARFGITDETTILTVARLDGRQGYKGHDRIIDALPALRTHKGNVIYVIAGVGEDRARLEHRAEARGVSKHVHFLGKVPDLAMPDLYSAADLFALPSTGEGFGIVYLEAMACGTPAIGLNVGGASDALVDGKLGWCVHEDEFTAALACALNAPRPNPDLLSSAVQARFGKEVFQRRVSEALLTLGQLPRDEAR